MTRAHITLAIACSFSFVLASMTVATGTDLCKMPNIHCQDGPADCSVKGDINGTTYCFRDERTKAYIMGDPKSIARLAEHKNNIQVGDYNCLCLFNLTDGECSGNYECF